jgi:hypothetical protein
MACYATVGLVLIYIGHLHRWALSPISVISDIGLSLILDILISD